MCREWFLMTQDNETSLCKTTYNEMFYCLIMEVAMKLHKIIKQKLTEQTEDAVIEKMGYGSLKVGRKSLKAFLNTKNVYEWLKEGHYDLKYASEPFVWKLVEVLGIPNDVAAIDIDKAKKRYQVLSVLKDPYLRAETNFRRNGQPIFALMFLSGKKSISIHKESLVYRTNKEIFKNIETLIRKHYEKYAGELPVLGKITHYLYSHTDGNTYKITTEGKLMNEKKETEEHRQC